MAGAGQQTTSERKIIIYQARAAAPGAAVAAEAEAASR